MKVILAEHFGMCFGVRDAIAAAERLATDGPLTILGELVHNPVVRDRLRARGVREGRLDQNADTPRVMITAHGASDARRAQWKSGGHDLIDGTCPLVRRAHDQLRQLVAEGWFPVVIGKHGHVEVQGLIGDFPQARVIETAADITQLPRECGRFGIISQTTQPLYHVRAMVEAIREARPAAEINFCDTVCQPTKNRQKALRQLLATCDTIVVVGGFNSNNTRQLVEAARTAQRRVFHIERSEHLRLEWFAGARVVGLTGGTSTLRETVAAVYERLQEISSTQKQQPSS